MHEKRLVDRLTKNWQRLRKEMPFPQFHHLNSDAICDVWDHCIVLELDRAASKHKPAYTYQYIGSEVIKVYGSDLTGHHVNLQTHNFPGWQVLKSVDYIFDSPEVRQSSGNFINDKDELVRYRACIMPFGTREKVSHALIGLSWAIAQ